MRGVDTMGEWVRTHYIDKYLIKCQVNITKTSPIRHIWIVARWWKKEGVVYKSEPHWFTVHTVGGYCKHKKERFKNLIEYFEIYLGGC